jgi:hypothetical protein
MSGSLGGSGSGSGPFLQCLHSALFIHLITRSPLLMVLLLIKLSPLLPVFPLLLLTMLLA